MEDKHFRALWVEEGPGGQFVRHVIQRRVSDLPEGEVLVRVRYSSLNYKDALSASGNRGVTRHYPHTPGIDAAGEVEWSGSPQFSPGTRVVAAASEVGVNSPGGYGQYIRVPASWLLPLPAGLSLQESMILGTAGFTAALMVQRLQRAGVSSDSGEILVTGATGGVGSVAVGILALEGYRVVALTGKPEQISYLHQLGAREVLLREQFLERSGKALLPGRWAGVVDTVGGEYLSTAIRSTRAEGVVTACGNAASPELSLTVFPFILRGVSLLGIDATRVSQEERVQVWSKLGGQWKPPDLQQLAREVSLDDLSIEIDTILRGGQARRVVVNLG